MMKQRRLSVRFTQILVGLALVLTLILVLVLAFIPQAKTLHGTLPPVPGDDWPTYLHDPQRTAATGPSETVISQVTPSAIAASGFGIRASTR